MDTNGECQCGADCAQDPEEEPGADQTVAQGESEGAHVLQEIRADGVNGFIDEAEEWEEVEFMVDSGAGTSVIGPENAKAVKATDSDSKRSYKLAHGSTIPHLGSKSFEALTQYEHVRSMNVQVTTVDKPLLSVSQVVQNGSTVVFSPQGS